MLYRGSSAMFLQRTLLRASREHPVLMRARAVDTWPRMHATWRGVLRDWDTREGGKDEVYIKNRKKEKIF